MTTDQILEVICLALYNSSSKAVFVGLAQNELSQSLFGNSYPEAVALLAAHKFTLSGRSQGASGSVTSLREAGLGIGFSNSGVSGKYSSTSYGQQLQQLIDNRIAGVYVLGNDDILNV